MRILTTILPLCVFIFTSVALPAQVIWSEPFAYPDGITTGANNNTANPANDWTSTCATCIPSSDWFHTVGGTMEGRDTNGPAEFTTEVIDISAYPGGVEFSIDLSESGTLEGCPSGTSSGCNAIDWIRIEYRLDGGAWNDYTSPLGGACAGSCAGATYVTFDDFTSTTFSDCPIIANTIQFRVSLQCWAGTEYQRFDNILVQGQTCALPIEITELDANVQANGTQVSWQMAGDETVDHFEIQRSRDGTNFSLAGRVNPQNSTSQNDFSFLDTKYFSGVMYYRLKMVSENGETSFSRIVVAKNTVHPENSFSLYPNPSQGQFHFLSSEEMLSLSVIDIRGKKVMQKTLHRENQSSLDLTGQPSGVYFLIIQTSDQPITRKVVLQ